MKKMVTIEAKRLELFTNLVAAFRLIDYREKRVRDMVTMPTVLRHARELSRKLGDITPEIKLTSGEASR